MIPWIVDLIGTESPVRVLGYITVRAAGALLLAFVLSLLFGPAVIRALRRLKLGQPILTLTHRENAVDLSEMHRGKAGTPTMGGALILIAIIVPAFLFCRLGNPLVWMLIVLTLSLAGVGWLDDYRKVTQQNSRGLLPRYKIASQALIGILLGAGLLLLPDSMQPSYQRRVTPAEAAELMATRGSAVEINEPDEPAMAFSDTPLRAVIRGHGYVMVPFFKSAYPHLGGLFLLWAMTVIVASSNAVNLTDGLDGLAIGVTTMVAVFLVVVAYVVARPLLAAYLIVPTVPGASEVAVLLACVIGASMGFLWFNAHPAEVFMGDVGSLMLGGLLGGIALTLKMELVLVIVGAVFVIETLSVIIQVGGYKLTGRRVFRMAPIHHHFEKLGLHESKIIARFWIVAALAALFGLATLKLR